MLYSSSSLQNARPTRPPLYVVLMILALMLLGFFLLT
jgi:hypothetical protein